MTDINRRDTSEISELSRAVFENPQVFVDRAESRFRDQLRGMTEKVATSGSHIVLLCGPSSSGKTTTANLLVSDLSALGRRAVRISLDDFYRNRDVMPLWEDGTKNFESIEGLDLECFSTSVNTLMREGHAEFPIFDFTAGKRSPLSRPMEYDENTILIFEGIHALQPQLRQGLASSNFGIYIHPNTSYVDQDGHTLLDARDLRLTRRIIRDNLHRGTPPLGTMQMWKDVLRGELLYMKPSSGTADVFVNTSHDYEPFLYAAVITGLLEQIEDAGENRETVERLLESYRHFFPIGAELIPQGSLIREFIGEDGECILGATPKKQQIGELLGAVVAAFTIGGVLLLLNSAWGFGTTELAAPQATLMKMITEGVMNGNLPWPLVLIGIFAAIVVEILGIPVLPVAIGLYLPLELSATIMIGGVIRWIVDKKSADKNGEASGGVLFCSGLIAGEGLVGILLAILAVVGVSSKFDLSSSVNTGRIGGIVLLAIMIACVFIFAMPKKKVEK